VKGLAPGAASDTGLVRERNEDRYWADAERGVYGAGGADGPDGAKAGATAVPAVRTTRAAGVRRVS